MRKEFILQQTSIPEKKYNSQTLIGNWYEEKCDPDSKYSNFYQERKVVEESYKHTTQTEVPFIPASKNWLNFQQQKKQNLQTTNQQEFKKPEEQIRNSVLKPFIVKKSQMEKDKEQLEQYREKWTKAPHFFDRTYIGTLQK